jgi:hypothetical protein
MSKKIEYLESKLANEMLKMSKLDAIRNAWEYFNVEPHTWYGHSSTLNKKTIVHMCFDEDGLGYSEGTILHMTENYDIYGTSEFRQENGDKFGSNPIFYYGNFPINTHDFELSFEDLTHGKIIFKPKKEAAFNYIPPLSKIITMDTVYTSFKEQKKIHSN